jgi:hypothetical protein
VNLQIEEEKGKREDSQGHVQCPVVSNEIGKCQENQFAYGKEVLDHNAGEQALFGPNYDENERSWRTNAYEGLLATDQSPPLEESNR